MKLLVVDDGPDNRFLFSRVFEKAGAVVRCAEDGAEGLAMAMQESYDVVLMDLQMPRMDGYTATAEMRRRGLTVPILAVTANAMAEDKRKTASHGFDAHITKPVNVNALVATVAQWSQRSAPSRQESG